MTDDGIGRLLVASLHQSIGDVLPQRLVPAALAVADGAQGRAQRTGAAERRPELPATGGAAGLTIGDDDGRQVFCRVAFRGSRRRTLAAPVAAAVAPPRGVASRARIARGRVRVAQHQDDGAAGRRHADAVRLGLLWRAHELALAHLRVLRQRRAASAGTPRPDRRCPGGALSRPGRGDLHLSHRLRTARAGGAVTVARLVAALLALLLPAASAVAQPV